MKSLHTVVHDFKFREYVSVLKVMKAASEGSAASCARKLKNELHWVSSFMIRSMPINVLITFHIRNICSTSLSLSSDLGIPVVWLPSDF